MSNDPAHDVIQELESIKRVYHRLVETPAGPPFYNVIAQLLPRLLSRIGQNHQRILNSEREAPQFKELLDNIHKKYLDMLTHIMKRVRPDEACKIPCVGIVDLLVHGTGLNILQTLSGEGMHMTPPVIQKVLEVDSYTLNFSFAFLSLGSMRCTSDEAESTLPSFLLLAGAFCTRDSFVSVASQNRSSQISHIILRLLEKIITSHQLIGSKLLEPDVENNDALRNNAIQRGRCMELVQRLLQQESVSTAIYDLLLDVFLYQSMPIDTDIPPPGLSPYGNERLKSGASMIGKDWREEYSSINRLVDLKKKLLEWIAPTRQWDPFLLSGGSGLSLNISRGISLLVIASGDSHMDVSERADNFLRALLDRRDKSLTIFSAETKSQLVVELLSLCLGDMVAHRVKGVSGPGDLKAMRRMISEKSVLSVLNFLSMRLLVESHASPFANPHLNSDGENERLILLMSTIIQCVCSSYLQAPLGKSFTAYSQFQLKTTPAASAHFLNLLCTQLSTLYDDKKKSSHESSISRIQSLLAKSLWIVTDHISSASTSYSGDTSKTIGVESRDGCYGVICTICRSPAVLDNPSIIFESIPRATDAVAIESDASIVQPFTSSTTSVNFTLAHTLFGCVAFEDNALRLRAMASLDALLFATVKALRPVEAMDVDAPKPNLLFSAVRSLLPCIWKAAKQKTSKLSRMSAVSWARDFVYCVDEISAAHIICFLAGDTDDSVSAAACAAIGFERILGEENYLSPFSTSRLLIRPKFSRIIDAFFPDKSKNDNWKPVFVDFSPKSCEVTLHFCLMCYNFDCGGVVDDSTIRTFYNSLTMALSKLIDSSSMEKEELDLLDAASAVLSELLRTSTKMRKVAIEENTSYGLDFILETIYRLRSVLGQSYLASGIYYLLVDFDLWSDHSSLDEWRNRVHFEKVLQSCLSNFYIHGAIFVAANYVKAFRKVCKRWSGNLETSWMLCSRVLDALSEGVLHTEDSIAIVCTTCLGTTLSNADAPRQLDRIPIATQEIPHGMNPIALNGISILKKLNECFSIASNTSNRLYALVRAVGMILTGISPIDVETERPIINSFFDLLSSRIVHQDPLLALNVGESLFSATSSTIVLQRLFDIELRKGAYQTRNSLSLCLLATLTMTLKMHSQEHKRSLVQGILGRLTEIHLYLFSILGDSKCSQVARESSCLALVVCRTLSTTLSYDQADLWVLLTRRLSVAFDKSNRSEDNTDASRNNDSSIRMEDSEILNVLRVLMNIAIDINYADVFYVLAVSSVFASNQFWSSMWSRERYSGLNLMGKDWLETHTLRQILAVQASKVLPVLLITRYDPDKNTSAIMNKLWASLASDSDDLLSISAHFLPLVDRLIENTSSKLWKTRVGSCRALSDIIVGKKWVDFGGGSSIVDEDDIMFEQIMPCECASVRIARLIRVTIRSLDDIRLTVREAGEVLSKSVKNLLVSLSDSSSLHGSAQISENASDALAAATSIPYLIKTGLNQSCVEAANFSISCLVGVVDVCRPKLIEPFIPSLIGALLMALSGIEPALLNNLQARAAGETLESEREVEQLRLRLADKSSLSSVITKVLNMVPQLDLESQRLVVFHLDKSLRSAHGLTTRSAVTDAIISVATKCPDAFIMNASTSRLLNAIYSAIYQEKKDTLMRGKFSYAIGFIANLAPSTTVRSLALKACDSYLENFDNFVARKNAASIVKSICEKATRHLSDGGPKDIWQMRVLPVAFVGKNDDGDIGSIWKDVWDEVGAVVMSSVIGYGVLLEERILLHLVSFSLALLRGKSWFCRRMACKAMVSLSGIVSPLPSLRIEKVPPHDVSRLEQRIQASASILSDGLRILVKKQLWNGKEELVGAVISTACRWVPITFAPLEAVQFTDLTGSASASIKTIASQDMVTSITPKWPISNNVGSWDDLFNGDNWFKRHSGRQEEEDNETDQRCECLESAEENEATVVTSDVIEEVEHRETRTESLTGNATVAGILHCLLDQATLSPNSMVLGLSEMELLPYKAVVLENLALFVDALQANIPSSIFAKELHIRLYEALKVYVAAVVDRNNIPPLLVARSISCIGSSLWQGMDDFSEVFSHFNHHTKDAAWTVRESSLLAIDKIAQRAAIEELRKWEILECMLSLSFEALRERKFHRIRYAGLKIMASLCHRVSHGRAKNSIDVHSGDTQRLFEALLPFKERILSMARKCLVDDEASIVDAASKLCTELSQWP